MFVLALKSGVLLLTRMPLIALKWVACMENAVAEQSFSELADQVRCLYEIVRPAA
jgi:hypothetical protein